jgi:FkbM family methyltransferase
MTAFDHRLPDSRAVADVVLAPLERAGVQPTVVDVGARNGFDRLPASYTRRAELVAFEPNPEEYRKLADGRTDAALAGYAGSPFRSTRYFDSALWDTDEERPFYVTSAAGASTLMGEAVPRVASRMFTDYPKTSPKAGKSFLEANGAVARVIPMKCRRLDGLLPASTKIDFLKLDVEGAELRVMRGAEALFAARSVLFVYTEFVMVPYYAEHPLFGDQQVFLRDHGFRLLDLELNHPRYSRGSTTLHPWADRRLISAGDACFMLDPDRVDISAEDHQRLAAICLCAGFHAVGIGLLREAGLCSAADIAAIEAQLAQVSWPRWLRRTWTEFPYQVAAGARRLRGALRSVRR